MLEHLKSRDFPVEDLPFWLNEDSVTFPVWNLSGQLVGYQRYRPEGAKGKTNDPRLARYFTRVKDGRVGVWGLETWRYTPHHLFITEGIFDACRLAKRGFSVIAILSHKPNPSTVRWLRTIHRTTTAVCDDDPAGRILGRLAQRSVVTPDGDLGDMTSEWISDMLNNLKLSRR